MLKDAMLKDARLEDEVAGWAGDEGDVDPAVAALLQSMVTTSTVNLLEMHAYTPSEEVLESM